MPRSALFRTPALWSFPLLLAGCPWIDEDELLERKDIDNDGFVDAQDCAEGDPEAHVGAEERCNDVDDDCDGAIDEEDAVGAPAWYPDADGDGHGEASASVAACRQPDGYAADTRDCDDADALAWSGAEEICNDGSDNDCDGTANACTLSGEIVAASPLLTGPMYEAYLGYDVAVGDALVLGSPGAGGFGGAVYVSDASGAVVGAVVAGTEHFFGFSVAAEGDTVASGGPASVGIACVWSTADMQYGDPISSATMCLSETIPSTNLGHAVALDAAQLAVSAPYDSSGAYYGGAVYVDALTPGLRTPSEARLAVLGTSDSAYLGLKLDDGCDGQGDGVPELAASAAGSGRVYVLDVEGSGAVAVDDAAQVTVVGELSQSFGYGLACGDFDGDGRDELAVGAPGAGDGAVYLFALDGASALVPAEAFAHLTDPAHPGLGVELAAADSDGDGTSDLFATSSGSGAVGVFLAPEGEAPPASAWIVPGEAGSGFGYALAAGDVTGDAVPDVVIGDPYAESYAGAVFLVAGVGL